MFRQALHRDSLLFIPSVHVCDLIPQQEMSNIAINIDSGAEPPARTATQLVKSPNINEGKSGVGTRSEPEMTSPKRGREEFTACSTDEPEQKRKKNSPDNAEGASETTESHPLSAIPPTDGGDAAAEDETRESEAKKKEESSVTKAEPKVSPAVLAWYMNNYVCDLICA